MNFGYSITISFVIWILGLVLVVALFMPDIQSNMNAVNSINDEIRTTSKELNINDEIGTDNLINYTPLSILSGLN